MNRRLWTLIGAISVPLFIASCGGGGEPAAPADAQGRRHALETLPSSAPPQLNAQWTQLSSAGVPTAAGGPGARVWTEMTWDSQLGEIVIFGGNGPQLYDNDIWSYKTETGEWTLIDPFTLCPGNDGFSKINGTDDTNFKYDPFNNLYWAFGGASGYRCISMSQARTAAAGSGPTVIVDPTLSSGVDGEYVGWSVNTASGTARVVGYSANTRTLTLAAALPALTAGTTYRLYATSGAGIWYFNPTTGTWTGQGLAPGDTTTIPTQGRIAAAVDYSVLDHAFVLWGGLSMGTDRRVWKLDVTTKQWTALPVPATGAPAHRREMLNSFVYDKANDVFILFGGVCSYAFDAACPEGAAMGETWAYRLSTNTWVNMNPTTAPSARAQQVMAYDEEHGVVVLFGGSTGGADANDTWVYHYPSNTWTQLATAAAPAPRRLAQVAYNPLTKQTILFGGSVTGTGVSGDIWALRLTSTGSGNTPPNVSLSAPAAGATYTAPASIALAANASDSDGSIAKVEFYAGATKIGEDTTAPYTLNWSNVAAGSYSLTAVATDNAGASTTSAAVAVTVTPAANVAPSVSLSAPAAGATYTAPASI
ncbi:MAG TPA: Ig-like domain-containing protein, partial [Rubrivivax sp.]|nr:Ig-like domain-containing protein [Rubrivivax sp.]